MPLSGRAPAEQPSALLSPLSPRLPAACGHNTAHRHRSTQCTVVRTLSRPAGSSPSSSPTPGRPCKRSRLGRKSVWRGHWLLSGPRLPERTEVAPVPDTQAQARSGASALDAQKRFMLLTLCGCLLFPKRIDAAPVWKLYSVNHTLQCFQFISHLYQRPIKFNTRQSINA